MGRRLPAWGRPDAQHRGELVTTGKLSGNNRHPDVETERVAALAKVIEPPPGETDTFINGGGCADNRGARQGSHGHFNGIDLVRTHGKGHACLKGVLGGCCW